MTHQTNAIVKVRRVAKFSVAQAISKGIKRSNGAINILTSIASIIQWSADTHYKNGDLTGVARHCHSQFCRWVVIKTSAMALPASEPNSHAFKILGICSADHSIARGDHSLTP